MCEWSSDGCSSDLNTLKEAWADGPVTYLGVQIHDFTNFFTLIAAHNGATFCNIPRCSEAQVEWLTELLRHALENKIDHIEPEIDAATQWTSHVYDLINQTLFPSITNSWFFGNFSNTSEHTYRYLVYSGGNPAYRKKMADVAENNYEGFALSRVPGV